MDWRGNRMTLPFALILGLSKDEDVAGGRGRPT